MVNDWLTSRKVSTLGLMSQPPFFFQRTLVHSTYCVQMDAIFHDTTEQQTIHAAHRKGPLRRGVVRQVARGPRRRQDLPLQGGEDVHAGDRHLQG